MLLSQYNSLINRRKLLLTTLVLLSDTESERTVRSCRVRKIFQKRKQQGAFHNLISEMRLFDPDKYYNYFRMSSKQFETLLKLVGPKLLKNDRFRTDTLSPAERLCITLRYLAIGDHMISLSYLHRIGKSTVSIVIKKTCKELWLCLKDIVLIKPTREDWVAIAEDFEGQWQFPNCIGGLDGKHVVVQAPPHSGSSYYNYKGAHSIVLMAACDANYCFTLIDVGAHGRQSDGGIFRASEMGKNFYAGLMDLPEHRPISNNGPKLPYVLVADEAFQLTNFLMRPFPGRNINLESSVYNYRLSRARRVIENAFGILAAKWRVYRKPLIANIDTIEYILLATVCLHNFLKKNEKKLPPTRRTYCPPSYVDRENDNGAIVQGDWRREAIPLPSVNNMGSNGNSVDAARIRNHFKNYFVNEGAIPWQWNRNGF